MNNDHVLSPDGQRVYFSASGHLYCVDVEGGDARRVSNVHPPEQEYSYWLHGVSPDESTLAYVSVEPEGDEPRARRNLATVPAAGGPDHQMTEGVNAYDGPEYSPDGKWLYYNSEEVATTPGHAQIFRMRPDGSGREQLTFDERVNWFPHLSPDGSQFVYISYDPGTISHPADVLVELRLLPADGGCPRRWRRSSADKAPSTPIAGRTTASSSLSSPIRRPTQSDVWSVVDGAIEGRQDPASPGTAVTWSPSKPSAISNSNSRLNRTGPLTPASCCARRPGGDWAGFHVLVDHRKSGSIGGFYGNGIGGFHAVPLGRLEPPAQHLRRSAARDHHLGQRCTGRRARHRDHRPSDNDPLMGEARWTPGARCRWRNIRIRDLSRGPPGWTEPPEIVIGVRARKFAELENPHIQPEATLHA